MLHVLYIVTDAMTVECHLRPQMKRLTAEGWRVGVVCGGDRSSLSSTEGDGVNIYHVPMRRDIHLVTDVVALVRLVLLLLRLRPAIVNAGTPKAGLIGMLASGLCRVPVRIYQLHGLKLETATGWRRGLLTFTERAACWCAQTVLCVSPSLKAKATQLRLCDARKLLVLGAGSCAGVDVQDYSPTAERIANAERLKAHLTIPSDAPVVGFIGRLTKDKGIVELLQAFSIICDRLPRAHLLLVGPVENGDPIPEDARKRIGASANIRHIKWADDPRAYLHLMDVLVLPTYREGLPGVLLEAAAAEKPVVATRATGVIDVVIDQVTGLLCPIGNARVLAQLVLNLLQDVSLARRISRNARVRVEADFSRERVLQNLEAFYIESWAKSGVKP